MHKILLFCVGTGSFFGRDNTALPHPHEDVKCLLPFFQYQPVYVLELCIFGGGRWMVVAVWCLVLIC